MRGAIETKIYIGSFHNHDPITALSCNNTDGNKP